MCQERCRNHPLDLCFYVKSSQCTHSRDVSGVSHEPWHSIRVSRVLGRPSVWFLKSERIEKGKGTTRNVLIADKKNKGDCFG